MRNENSPRSSTSLSITPPMWVSPLTLRVLSTSVSVTYTFSVHDPSPTKWPSAIIFVDLIVPKRHTQDIDPNVRSFPITLTSAEASLTSYLALQFRSKRNYTNQRLNYDRQWMNERRNNTARRTTTDCRSLIAGRSTSVWP